MRVAIIDGDSIPYICSKYSLRESLINIDAVMQDILAQTESDCYYLFLSLSDKYFRHKINPDYKGNRSGSPLLWLKTLRYYLVENYGAVSCERVEADDLCAYTSTNADTDTIVCSPDKDVLNQIGCTDWYNYKKRERGSTTAEDAVRFLYKQCLMGDSGDNIQGLPGIGDKKSDKLIIECTNPQDYRNTVILAYHKYYEGIGAAIYKFQKTFRQVYLLRKDIDFLSEVGYVPVIGTPRELNSGERW